MPEIIERGYLYIAQPPLYRVTRGKKSRYIANDNELFEFLLEHGSEGKEYFSSSAAPVMSGERLQTAIRSIHRLQNLQSRLSQRIDAKVLKYLVESGNTSISMMRNREELTERMEALDAAFKRATRVDETLTYKIHEDEEDGSFWVQFQRRDHGRVMISRLNKDLVGTAEFGEAQKLCVTLQNLVEDGAYLLHGDKRWEITHFDELAGTIEAEGRKGLNIQRYKGLGEMDPEQLWETTMDPANRIFKRVTLEDVVNADETFSTLMGDAVEPRRRFIQDNALKVQNLDV